MKHLLLCSLACSIPIATTIARVQDDEPRKRTVEVWSQSELEKVSEAIRREIEAMRGVEFKRPVHVKLTDKKGFIEYAKRRTEATQTPERMQRDELVAKLLGLIPMDTDLQATLFKFLEDQVGGFYDPASDTFYLMDGFTGDVARIILAHELTHALDDQCFDLDGTLESLQGETDAELAYQAVVEGSGTALMNEWTIKHMKEIDLSAMMDFQAFGVQALTDAPPYIWKPLLAVYLRGEGFLTKSRAMNFLQKKAKTEDIQAAFRAPPRSFEQILHPDKYWTEPGRDEPRRASFDTSRLAEGWRVVGEDTLGELMLGLVIAPPQDRGGVNVTNPLAMLGIKYTHPASEGWGGDRVALLAKGDAHCLVLVSLWDSTGDAEEFRAALTSTFAGSVDRDSISEAPAYKIGTVGPANSVVLTAHSGLKADEVPEIPWSVITDSSAPGSRPAIPTER